MRLMTVTSARRSSQGEGEGSKGPPRASPRPTSPSRFRAGRIISRPSVASSRVRRISTRFSVAPSSVPLMRDDRWAGVIAETERGRDDTHTTTTTERTHTHTSTSRRQNRVILLVAYERILHLRLLLLPLVAHPHTRANSGTPSPSHPRRVSSPRPPRGRRHKVRIALAR